MKGRIAVIAVVLLAFLCLGMSGLGGTSEKKFPHPSKNFKATIIDMKMVKTTADLMACEGITKFTAYRGDTRVQIPFRKISKMVFSDHDERYREVKVTFWDNETYDVLAKNFQVCTGRTELGEMFIKVKDIKEVEFEKGEFSGMEDPTPTPAPEPKKP